MKVSVVMTTYNGEKYIFEQLESIYNQTQLPDEVIICDDCSSDNTTYIVKEFIQTYTLNNWRLFINEENKGWQRNFLEAMEKATGDVLFLCDQDDIWLNDKIEYMVNTMKSNDQIKCLSGNIITINESGQVLDKNPRYSPGNNTNIIKKIPYSNKFNTLTLLGCSLCVTSDIAELIKKLNVKNYSHDAQICRLANLLDNTYYIDKAVIKYRIHSNNTSGVNSDVSFGSNSLFKRISAIENNILWLEALLNYYQTHNELEGFKISAISKTKEMQEKRYDFLTSKSLFKYIALLKYKKYYSNNFMIIGDFSYAYNINKLAGKSLWVFKMILNAYKDLRSSTQIRKV